MNTNQSNLESMAAALYDGGWRSSDAAELQKEHDLTDDECKLIVRELKKMETI